MIVLCCRARMNAHVPVGWFVGRRCRRCGPRLFAKMMQEAHDVSVETMQSGMMQGLSNAHRKMERVLTLIRLQLDMLRTTSSMPGFTLLKNAIGYMRNYPGIAHHPMEEIIFARLAEHAPEARKLCVSLQDQHNDFGRTESALLGHIRSAKSGNPAARQHLLQAGVAYCATHAGHIRSEENEAFPLAIKCLPEVEWRKIGDLAVRLIAPLPSEGALDSYESLYDYLMAEGGKFDLH